MAKLTSENFAANFLTVLSDDRVQNKLFSLFEPIIALTIEEKFNSLLKSKVDGLNATIQSLRDDLKIRDETINNLQSDNNKLKQEVSKLRKSNDDLEQFTRKDNLIISGLPASYAERVEGTAGNKPNRESSSETIDKIVKLCNDHLHCSITATDISTAHRLSSNANSQILVRFVRRSVRDRVYRARFGLKTHNAILPQKEKVFINEDLSPQTRSLFAAAWKAKGLHNIEGVWTNNCHIFIKLNGSAAPLHLHSMVQLQSLPHLPSLTSPYGSN
jgi:FtsZ-binding cell division protein ZapB